MEKKSRIHASFLSEIILMRASFAPNRRYHVSQCCISLIKFRVIHLLKVMYILILRKKV